MSVAWLAGEPGSEMKGYFGELMRSVEEFSRENQAMVIVILGVLFMVVLLLVLKRAFAPRAQRGKDIAALVDALSRANRLSEEERALVEDAAEAAMLENPAHLFVRPTVWDAAVRALLSLRPKEREKLSFACDELKRRLHS